MESNEQHNQRGKQWADKSGWERIAEAQMEWSGGDPRNPDYESMFLGVLSKGTKLGQRGRQIPGELGTIVEAMNNKECQDSITQISSKLTTYYRSVTEHHMRPEWETKYKIGRRRLKGRADPSNQGRTLRSHPKCEDG